MIGNYLKNHSLMNLKRNCFADLNKKKVVILGSGWGGFRIANDLNQKYWDVTVVSPRNHFIFTPMLPSTTVGTLEYRAIIEPVRKVVKNYYQAKCLSVDEQNNTVSCQDEWHKVPFTLKYDYLVIAVGSRPNTFRTPGVEENCFFLREIPDARKIRQRLINCLEIASSQFSTPEEKQKNLTFCVIGGGPTSVEFAAELNDFLASDLKRKYIQIKLEDIHINLIESTDHILGSFDKSLGEYAEKTFKRNKINIMTNKRVLKVENSALYLNTGEVIPFGLCVWSTGNTSNDFVQSLPWEKEKRSGRLIVDDHLRVKGKENIFAIGDCSVNEAVQLPQTAQCAQQEAMYLAYYFKQILGNKNINEIKPFIYRNLGMMAYIGNYKALADVKQAHLKGFLTWFVWRSVYLTKLVSITNKFLVPMYWFKTFVFGRDISSF